MKFIKNNKEIIEAVSSVIVAFFTIFTFYSWRTSVAMLDQQTRADIAQNRPYLSVDGAVLGSNGKGDYTVIISIKNRGRTPAYEVKFSDYNLSQPITNTSSYPSQDYMGPDQSVSLKSEWSLEKVKQFISGSKDFYGFKIEYSDHFGNKCVFTSELHTFIPNNNYEFSIKNQHETCAEK